MPSLLPRPLLVMATLLVMAGTPRAGQQVVCQIDQGGETWQLSFAPTATPYEAIPVDIHGQFRFKAVVLGTPDVIEHVTLSSQYILDTQAVPLHQSTHLQPRLPTGASRLPLGGRQAVYSPRLGREMRYECALTEALR